MRILILITRWKGGVGNSNKRLKKALEKKGHSVNIIAREEDLEKKTLLTSIFTIRRYIKENGKKYDTIYSQDWSMAFPLIVPYPLSWKKHFCCFCGLEEKKIPILLQRIIGGLFRKKLVVVTDKMKNIFKSSNLIYRGIDLKEFKPLNKKRVYLGWAKQIGEIIDENFIKRLAKEINIDYLIARGIPPNKMNRFYNRCKIFISLPVKEAGFNNVWTEAMAAGVPIVIGNGNSVGKKWPIEKVYKENNWIKEIKEIIKNPKRKDYRRWLIEKGINWESTAEKVLKVFRNR